MPPAAWLLALGVLAMALLDKYTIPDAALTAAAAALTTILVILPTARIRKGECLHCRYSLAGATLTSKGLCTECGERLGAAHADHPAADAEAETEAEPVDPLNPFARLAVLLHDDEENT